MPNNSSNFNFACNSALHRSSSYTYSKLLALDSAFYQPKRWKSWYVKQLTRNLSIQDSIERHQFEPVSELKSSQQYKLPITSSPQSKPTTKPHSSKMIKAMHQFSTIKTTYSDTRKSFVSDVNPQRAMLVQVEFEVFGEVSGVYFTKYARSMCDSLNIKGWIRVSPRGTVYGQIQGEKEKVDEMALWLRLQGSPGSKIEYCQFRNWKIIDSCDFRNFTIRY